MIHSRDRILTTHVGSLPRSETLSELLMKREAGESYDAARFETEMEKAVRHVVAKQKEAGIDIGNDGEQQRVGFQTYVPQRMSGFAGVSKRRRGREFEEFPELVRYLTHRFPHVSKQQNAPEAQGELHYHDTSAIKAEIARFKRVADEGTPFAEAFMTAPSPGIIASTMLNAHYASQEDYLAAIAREMRNEYRAIHESGLILQIDAYGCIFATAIGKARTSTTSRWKRSCRRFIRLRSARCRSNFPIRATRTNMGRLRVCRFRKT